MRAFLAILAGIILGLALQSAGDLVASLIYPIYVADLLNHAEVSQAMAARPPAALALGIAGYFAGGLVGGLVGKSIWRRPVAAWVPAAVLALMALVIDFSYPIPAWAMFATFMAPLIGGLLANHLVKSAAPAEAVAVDAGDAPADL
jgi:hypothetical protein